MKMVFSRLTTGGMAILLGASLAQAARLGHPGISTHSTNATQNQWNLLCDPVDALDGTTSTSYDGKSISSIYEVYSVGNYKVTSLTVQVDTPSFQTMNLVFSPTDTTDSKILPVIPAGDVETGYLRVAWTVRDPALLGSGTDDDTYGLIFKNKNSADMTQEGTFTNYLDPGQQFNPTTETYNTGHFPTPDFYDIYTPPNTQNYTRYTGDNPPPGGFLYNTVQLPAGTPEPASLAILGMTAATALVRRRRA